MLTLPHRIRHSLVAFADDRRGDVILMFGLAVLGLFAAIGLAIDGSRAIRTQTAAKAALDAAALAGAKALRVQGATRDEVIQIVNLYFNENFKRNEGGRITLSELDIEVDDVENRVTINTEIDVPTFFGHLFDVDSFGIPSTSTAIYDAKDVELGMMLDVSGSMQGTKIEDLKHAAKDLVDIILSANNGDIHHKIAIAPYSTAVNAGEYAAKVTVNDKKGSDTTCVSERKGTNAFIDVGPDVEGLGNKPSWCPEVTILPLSEDKTVLKTHLDGMIAEGTTAGHLGTAWAWYLVSPRWASVWPAASQPAEYDDRKVMKAVIIMTDGMFNKEYESSNGKSAAQARELCKKMKARGLTVFSVGFEAPADALEILQNCASSPDDFFDAKDGEALKSAFRAIANRLMALRIAG